MKLAVIDPVKKEPKFKADPLVSMIVPIYDLPAMVLKRCLMSLATQDYENKEVICVLDGPNPELRNIAEKFIFTDKPCFRLIEIEHGGACVARNEGFKVSKGEIVSFFNSDYVAKPGMIRLWVDTLVDHPDCGFVYSGYEYNSSRRWTYPSGSFEPSVLNAENFIDCGFPLWRKHVVEWDKDVLSLQDWDFWLRVVKSGVKGHFIERDYSFVAEMPRPKGLSMDSSSNWNDRVDFIKKKNGIKANDILVTSIGAPNHGLEIAKMVGADFRRDTWHKTDWLSTYKALYMIGFYIKPNEGGLNEHARRLAMFKDHNPKAKRIVHFVGADIYWLRKFPWDSLKYLAGALRQSTDKILSENQAAHDELLEFGIPSEIVPIPSYTEGWEVKPLPKDFKVAVYLVDSGQSDFDKYCYEQTLSIVRGMPDVQFTGYGKAGVDLEYPNLKHYGSIPRDKWPDYVYENSALLRLVRHDTQPMASREFLTAGRPVISNIHGECSTFIDTAGKDDISSWDKFGEGMNVYRWPQTKAEVIRAIRKVKKQNELFTSYKGRLFDSRFVMENDLKSEYISKIRGMCGL
jgi:glycosyltransferase involved in cell wall biosynthesis